MSTKTLEEILGMSLADLGFDEKDVPLLSIANKKREPFDPEVYEKPPFKPCDKEGIKKLYREAAKDAIKHFKKSYEEAPKKIRETTAGQVIEGWKKNYLWELNEVHFDRVMIHFHLVIMSGFFQRLLKEGVSLEYLATLPAAERILKTSTMEEIFGRALS